LPVRRFLGVNLFAEVHDMNRTVKVVPVLTMVLTAGVVFTAAYRLSAQQATSATTAPVSAESRAFRPGSAPGLKVTDLGRSSGHTYRLNMVKGDEIISGLLDFAEKNHIKNGHFTGLGAIDKATLRWSDPVNKTPSKTEINEEAEIVSLVGSIAQDKDGKPGVHAHTVFALQDGSTRGGHLQSARVSIIAEIFVTDEESAGAVTNASR
jgi:predicted DNA-binding protein with PD1-like motif